MKFCYCAMRSCRRVVPTLAPGEPIASVSDGRPARALSVQITSVSDGRPLSSAGTSHRGAGPAPTADPHQGTRAGDSSSSHFPMVPSPAVDDTTMPTAPAATTLTASSSLDVTVGTAAGATATAASAAGTGMEIETDPVPTTTTPPTAEHISSFLLCIRRRAANDATATAASAAETLITPPSPEMNVHATDGATAHHAASATAV